MVKVFRCRDTGSNCDWVGHAAGTEEMVKIATSHIHQAHGMALNKELEASVMKHIKSE